MTDDQNREFDERMAREDRALASVGKEIKSIRCQSCGTKAGAIFTSDEGLVAVISSPQQHPPEIKKRNTERKAEGLKAHKNATILRVVFLDADYEDGSSTHCRCGRQARISVDRLREEITRSGNKLTL
jgi:hypothetical protein